MVIVLVTNVCLVIIKCLLFRRDQFLHWVENLHDRQSPSWLGLPNNAEKMLLLTRGNLFSAL